MQTYKKTLNNGNYFLLEPNTTKEKLVSFNLSGGDAVIITKRGTQLARREIQEDSVSKYFVHFDTRYNVNIS